MQQELMRQQQSDGWDSVPENTGQLIIGAKLKFKDGAWFADGEKVGNAKDATFAVADVTVAWVHWLGKKPIEHRVTKPGQRHPERDELPDRDEKLWEPGLDGSPEDPWKDTRYVLLIDIVSAAEFTFITDTHGGRRAVRDLKRQVSNSRRARLWEA